jgi:hypothetical protein
MKACGEGVKLAICAVLPLTVSGQLHALVTLLLGEVPHYPLNRRLDGPWDWSGCCGEETPVGNQPFISGEASSLVSVWTELSQL